MDDKIGIFINSTLSENKTSIKYQSLYFLYQSIRDNDNPDCHPVELITNKVNNINCKVCVMLSFFKKLGTSKGDILRREIYNNNIKSKWIFFEANPLARYRLYDFKFDNEFLRICLNSQYHAKSLYLNGNKERWNMILDKTGIKVLPWRKTGNHILFVLNSCKFCGYSMQGEDIHLWTNNKIKEIRNSGCTRKIVIRLKCSVKNLEINKHYIRFNHITDTKTNKIEYYDPFGNISLANTNKRALVSELENAWACVLYSTTACVISVIKGIPVFCSSKNTITYDISNTDFSKIETPIMPDRTHFFHQFANQIWSLEELKNGVVWNEIKKISF
jgi:hypothetical protein